MNVLLVSKTAQVPTNTLHPPESYTSGSQPSSSPQRLRTSLSPSNFEDPALVKATESSALWTSGPADVRCLIKGWVGGAAGCPNTYLFLSLWIEILHGLVSVVLQDLLRDVSTNSGLVLLPFDDLASHSTGRPAGGAESAALGTSHLEY